MVTASAGPLSQQVIAQASASVVVNPIVLAATGLSLTKTTATTSYVAVGAAISYTLTATNTGNVSLSGVTISDTNATTTGCGPATLAPGESLTCAAVHIVTQADLDRGSVTNTATVTGTPPSGPAATAASEVVVVPAATLASLSLTKSTTAASFSNAGESIAYTISATNTGNVTLRQVTITDPNATISGCDPIDLAPGQTLSCVAVHTVTGADVAAKVIVNQAQASVLPSTGSATVTFASNTVRLSRIAPLPFTGAEVNARLLTAGALVGLGAVLLVAGRRRRRPAR